MFDLGDPDVPCDLLIDYNINFSDFDFPHAGKTLLGPRYAPLRGEFSAAPKRLRESISQALITVGGADGRNVAEKLMCAVAGERGLDGVFFHVVSGAANPWADSLTKISNAYPGRFLVHQNVKDMAALMNIADAALTAGGSTLYELCAMGVPCVALSIADNQDRIVEAMEDAGIMISADRVATARDAACAARELAMLRKNPEQIKRMAKAARGVADGAGARRIAYEMVQLDNRGPSV
jgi:spore coat polysaccharide biosynthesis predicted glycosyltransferase SpsG